jgi:hypothetical protein
MMRTHTFSIAVAALVCVLLLAGVVLAQSGGPALPLRYAVEQGPALSAVEGIASGGHYRLVSTSWQASGAASGGGYRLLGPASPASSENGCCCLWLPCTLRNR